MVLRICQPPHCFSVHTCTVINVFMYKFSSNNQIRNDLDIQRDLHNVLPLFYSRERVVCPGVDQVSCSYERKFIELSRGAVQGDSTQLKSNNKSQCRSNKIEFERISLLSTEKFYSFWALRMIIVPIKYFCAPYPLNRFAVKQHTYSNNNIIVLAWLSRNEDVFFRENF